MDEIRLLLVDDEISFLNPIAKRLKKRGYIAELATSGEEALSALEKRAADVVVLDVKMPGMNGIETLQQIKSKYPDTEVILLTGQASTQDGVEGIKSGAFDYLTKPIELEHLIGKIRQAYDKILHKEEKRKEAEFRSRLEQQMIATERLASLGTLATGVAHEINNPLAIIKESAGYMALLLTKKEMADFSHRKHFELAIGKIETAIERARRITHKLLGFVKKNESVFSEVNLRELIDETVQLIYREAANKDIEIVHNTGDQPFVIRSDPYQLRQVLINLLTNAIHATGSRGNITLSLEAANGMVVLTVKDTGVGIPRENLEKIFEPFFSTKSPGQGTGLGLFVTHNIIKKLGGTIDVESTVGKGTKFKIRLPEYYEMKPGISETDQENWFGKLKMNL
jgi:signal transduction histidine kinase